MVYTDLPSTKVNKPFADGLSIVFCLVIDLIFHFAMSDWYVKRLSSIPDRVNHKQTAPYYINN